VDSRVKAVVELNQKEDFAAMEGWDAVAGLMRIEPWREFECVENDQFEMES
jgi:hypothetical protein